MTLLPIACNQAYFGPLLNQYQGGNLQCNENNLCPRTFPFQHQSPVALPGPIAFSRLFYSEPDYSFRLSCRYSSLGQRYYGEKFYHACRHDSRDSNKFRFWFRVQVFSWHQTILREDLVELVGIELLRILKTDKLLIRRESYNAHNA